MIKKEWLEVCKQSLYFVLATAGMVLLGNLANLLQGKPPFAAETNILILGLWLLMFSMFLGLSPFALDSKQKGMEYLLTLPFSRRRLLWIKLLPRLAAVVLFYFAFAFLYGLLGNNAFAGGFTIFSLTYFSLFLISFSLSLVHENFIVQSIWAGITLCGYLATGLFICAKGRAWKFAMPISWMAPGHWRDLAYDVPSLFTTIAVFILLAAPFVVSLFLAIKKFDLRPTKTFNRRQLLFFVPMLLLALAISLGAAYLVQKNSAYEGSDFYILKDQRLLEASFPGKLALYTGTGRQRIDTKGAFFWDRLLLEEGERLYLSGFDIEDGNRFIGCLNLINLSWEVLHRCPDSYFVAPGFQGINYDGENFVYLRRTRAEAERPGMDSHLPIKSDGLELVLVDPLSGQSRTITFRSPLFKKYYEPQFFGCDKINGRRFWLIAHRWREVLRLWGDGRVDDLGLTKGLPAYAGGLLFTRSDNSLQVRRLLDADAGSETIREIAGDFNLVNTFRSILLNKQAGEIYARRDKRIVRIDLTRLDGVAVDDVGPERGHIWMVSSGEFYYVEFETWPGRNTDKWKKLYRLQGGKLIFLKQFDFNDDGYGNILVDTLGVIFWQNKINKRTSILSTRFFAFPDLRELKFKKLD